MREGSTKAPKRSYIFFFLLAAYFVYAAAETRRMRDFILAGVFAGAAFEVRQDALFYAFVAGLWLAGVIIARREWRRFGGLAAFAAAALVLAAPFLVYTRAVTGVWGTGPRFSKTFEMRDTFAPVIAKNAWNDALASYFRLNADGTELDSAYYGVSPWHCERMREGHGNVGVFTVLGSLRPRNIVTAWRMFLRWVVPGPLGWLGACGDSGDAGRARAVGERDVLRSDDAACGLRGGGALSARAVSHVPRAGARPFHRVGDAAIIAVGARLVPRLAGWAAPAALIVAAGLSAYGAATSIRAQAHYRSLPGFERVIERLQRDAAARLARTRTPMRA